MFFKKMYKVLAAIVAVALFLSALTLLSCESDDDDDDDGGHKDKPLTAQEAINNGDGDLTGKTITDDVVITTPMALSNADFGGKKITIKSSGVTLSNIKNANVVVEATDGALNVDDCTLSGLTVPSSTKVAVSGETTITNAAETNGGKLNIVASEDTNLKDVFTDKTDSELGGLVNKVTVTSVTLKADDVLTSYAVGEEFDYSGLKTTVNYSDYTSEDAICTKNNTTLTGFNTSEVGTGKTATVKCTICGVDSNDVTVTYDVTAKKSLIQQGIDLLNAKKYDEGLKKFEAAYKESKTDETKLYYALTKIAKLSANEDLKSLLKDNLGVKNYPGTLNALLTEGGRNGWWDEFVSDTQSVTACKVEKDETGYYIRVSGTPLTWEDYYNYDGDTANILYLYDKDGDVFDRWDYKDVYGTDYGYLGNPQTDNNGKCFVSVDDMNLPSDKETQLANFVYGLNENYDSTTSKSDYTMGEKSDYIRNNYVRVSATETQGDTKDGYTYIGSKWGSNVYKKSTTQTEDSTSVNVDKVEMDSFGIKTFYNVKASATGEYFISYSDYAKLVKQDTYKDYLYKIYDYEEGGAVRKEVAVGTKRLPALKDVSWLNDDTHKGYYDGTLVGGAKSVTTFGVQLIANVIDGNPEGLNNAIDKVAKVFSSDIDSAASIIDSMGETSVTVPADLLKALCLDGVLGEDTIKVSKAEGQCLTGAFKVLQGVLQYLQGYDFSCNVTGLKDLFISDISQDEIFDKVRALELNNFLATRDAAKITGSKTAITAGIDQITTSLDKMLSKTTSDYPQAVIDILRDNCTCFNSALKLLSTKITAGEKFPVASNIDLAAAYPADEASASFTVDTNKIFTSGTFSNLLDKDNTGKVNIYYSYEYEYYNWPNGIFDGETDNFTLVTKPSDIMPLIKTDILGKVNEGATDDNKSTWSDIANDCDVNGRISYYVKIAGSELNKFISGEQSDLYIKVMSNRFSKDDIE